MNYADFCLLNGLCAGAGGIGSIYKLWAIRTRDVLDDRPCRPGQTISTPLLLRQGANVAQYTFAPDTARYTATERPTKGGPVIDYRVEGFEPSLKSHIDDEIKKLRNGRYILILHFYPSETGQPGEVKRVGSLERPMRFLADTDSDRNKVGNPGSSLQWYSSGAVCDVCPMDPAQPIPNTQQVFTPVAADTMDESDKAAIQFDDAGDKYQGVSLASYSNNQITRTLQLQDDVSGLVIDLVEITYTGGTGSPSLTFNWLQSIDASDLTAIEATITASSSPRGIVVDWDELDRQLKGIQYYCGAGGEETTYNTTGTRYLAAWGFTEQQEMDGLPHSQGARLLMQKQISYLGKVSNVVTNIVSPSIRRIKTVDTGFTEIIETSSLGQLLVSPTLISNNCSASHASGAYYTTGSKWYNLQSGVIDVDGAGSTVAFTGGSSPVGDIGFADGVYFQAVELVRENGMRCEAGLFGKLPLVDAGGGLYPVPVLAATCIPLVTAAKITFQTEVYEGFISFGYTVASRTLQVRDFVTGQVVFFQSLTLNQSQQDVDWVPPQPYDVRRKFLVTHELAYSEQPGQRVYQTFELQLVETF